MVVIINSPSKYYTFVTDRGEIYCNDKIICDGSYRYFEKEDTFPKLLSVIKSEVKCFFTFTHGFKYIQKLPEISFLFALHKQKSLTKPEKSGGVRLFCVFAVCLFLCNFVGFGVFFDVKMMSKFQSSKKRTRWCTCDKAGTPKNFILLYSIT